MVAEVIYGTREDLLEELEGELEEAGVTMEEFRAEGEADTLTDGHLRDLWLYFRHDLFEE